MKNEKLIFILFSVCLLILGNSCSDGLAKTDDKITELEVEEIDNLVEAIEYDSLLAQKYGADQYGMKKYVMAFLKKGPNREEDSTKRAQLQAAHMENIGKLAEQGKLVLAGPFFGKGDLRGIYIFDVRSIAEAEELTKTDPAVQSGSLIMELKEWYGSAALMGVNEQHDKISKIKI